MPQPLARSADLAQPQRAQLPNVVLHYTEKNWLLLVESVTSHGPVDGKRHGELRPVFRIHGTI